MTRTMTHKNTHLQAAVSGGYNGCNRSYPPPSQPSLQIPGSIVCVRIFCRSKVDAT